MAGHQSTIRVHHTTKGLVRYEIELWHDELHKHRIVREADKYALQKKVELQLAEWEEQWQKKVDLLERANRNRLQEALREEKVRIAGERTLEAQKNLSDLACLLKFSLERNDAIDWEALKDQRPYPYRQPEIPSPPIPPKPHVIPPEPLLTDARYKPQSTFLDQIFAARRQVKTMEASRRYQADHDAWAKDKQRIEGLNEGLERDHRQSLLILAEEHKRTINNWEAQKQAFLTEQRQQNALVDQQKVLYLQGVPDSIVAYAQMVLALSQYPDYFSKELEIEYRPEAKLLLINYSLPSPEALPMLLEVKYIAVRDEFAEKSLPQTQAQKLYDEVLYQVFLRTLHEIFEADIIQAIDTVVLNGFVRSIDKGTGQEVNACVLSIQTNRIEFLAINLENIDPKACFKQLKGVGSSKLHSITPVAPLVQMSREDHRFVPSHEVADQLSAGDNLAAMDWEDFEHLIRELFEKEFSSTGGEVRVTQASRDGGVDAIAFDPDPIRGGKIVIQAKRYTNTVGVAAVRDLYGTLMNEGATKGILVTTSDYGPDAYEFARGKPLTLLNGGNLLHLLQKHGHLARIDLKEAKKILGNTSGQGIRPSGNAS